MAQKLLALTTDGRMTYCSCPPEQRGRGRCNHVDHQAPNESVEDFIKRINNKINIDEENSVDQNIDDVIENAHEITTEEINNLASEIDKIAGVKITLDNYEEVLNSLTPDQIDQITKVSFDAAPSFSLPISDEDYEDENIKNKLYFANLPSYGIAGNKDSIAQMFDKVGNSHTSFGDVQVDHSYKDGLTPDEYFARQFIARDAEINKSVSTSKPGYCIYENSIVEIKDNNGNLIKVKWSEVNIGDEFVDGSICEEIRDWQEKPCYEIKIEGYDKIVLSNDHLVNGRIYIGEKWITNLKKSQKSRENIGEKSEEWICIEDIFDYSKQGAHIQLNENAIEYIKPFKNLRPQKVRCISSSTGFYETNGITHHNTARKCFYAMSDTQVVEDCGGEHIDVMHCSMPEGHICVACARKTQGGGRIKAGQLVGGWVSTNISEALTQLSMKQKHVGSDTVSHQLGGASVIMSTLDGWGTSPIIQKMKEAKTTDEMRQIMYEGLKQQYKDAGIKQDDFNIQMVARKLTSYKRTNEGLRPVNPGEKADIVSMQTVGNYNNVFKVSELTTGYKHLTKPLSQKLKTDAANEILN